MFVGVCRSPVGGVDVCAGTLGSGVEAVGSGVCALGKGVGGRVTVGLALGAGGAALPLVGGSVVGRKVAVGTAVVGTTVVAAGGAEIAGVRVGADDVSVTPLGVTGPLGWPARRW